MNETKLTWQGRLTFMLSRMLLVSAGLLLSLALLELLLRVVAIPNRFELDRQSTALWESDDELLLHLKPNLDLHITAHPEFAYTVRTNAQGLRNGPFNGVYDVAAIGDSFTFGFGVEGEEAWPAQLATASGLRVANLGWAGWNPYVYPAAIRRHALPLKTRIWVWTFFVNDLRESDGAETFISSGKKDYLAYASVRTSRSPLLELRSLELLVTLLNPEFRLLPGSGSIVFDDGVYRMRISEYPWEQTDPADPAVQHGWQLTEAALEQARQLADANGARLMVAFIPPREQVYWPYIQAAAPAGHDIRQLDDVEARLAAICADQGIAYLNLLPGFRQEAASGAMLYFPADGHWNPAGHSLAARLIAEKLAVLGWPSP